MAVPKHQLCEGAVVLAIRCREAPPTTPPPKIFEYLTNIPGPHSAAAFPQVTTAERLLERSINFLLCFCVFSGYCIPTPLPRQKKEGAAHPPVPRATAAYSSSKAKVQQ